MVATNEFSRIISIAPWPADGIAFDVEAEAMERNALAKRFDLVDLGGLTASGKIERRKGVFFVNARVQAQVTQRCVVTLGPVDAGIDVRMERCFQPGPIPDESGINSQKGKNNVVVAAVEVAGEEDDVEILASRDIDVGELIAEELYLALDPYPRAANADEVLAAKAKARTEDDDDNPFARLKRH